MEPLIITVALTGAEITPDQQPNLPITIDQLIADAEACWGAGATMVHLHVRKPDGTPTQDRDVFQAVVAGIRARTDLIVQVSTGGAVWMSEEERMQSLDCAPDMATLTCGTVNFGDDIFINSHGLITRLAARMRELSILPELEIFDLGMISTARRLQADGLVPSQAHFDLVLGVRGGAPGTPEDLIHLVRALPPESSYSVAGVGGRQLPLNTMAIILGGHVRTGFEDNFNYLRGILAESNAQLVRRIVRMAGELGRPVATATEARRILGLPM